MRKRLLTIGLTFLTFFSSAAFGYTPSSLYQPFSLKDLDIPSEKASVGSKRETIQLNVVDTHFLCAESECTHHHSGCRLEIEYLLSAENTLALDIGASVFCKASLRYQTSHGYELKSERCTRSQCHKLEEHAELNSSLVIGFNFSPYEEVVSVQVDSIECTIDTVESNGVIVAAE